jgi:hypothetical protein
MSKGGNRLGNMYSVHTCCQTPLTSSCTPSPRWTEGLWLDGVVNMDKTSRTPSELDGWSPFGDSSFHRGGRAKTINNSGKRIVVAFCGLISMIRMVGALNYFSFFPFFFPFSSTAVQLERGRAYITEYTVIMWLTPKREDATERSEGKLGYL